MAMTGGCHCGAIRYTLAGDAPTSALDCNCSYCRKQGYLLHFAPAAGFTLHTDRDAFATYSFNKRTIAHHACRTCGCTPFGEGAGDDGKPFVMLNLRCADIDLDALTLRKFDGASA